MTIINWLNLLDQVLNKLTLLVSLIELSEVGVCAQNKVFNSSYFESLDVSVASFYKIVIEDNQLGFLLLFRSLNQHFLELHLDIIDCRKGRFLWY